MKFIQHIWGFPGGPEVKNPPAMQETRVPSLGQEDPLEEGMATHSSILAWRNPWTEEPEGLQSVGSHRVRHDWATKQQHRAYILAQKWKYHKILIQESINILHMIWPNLEYIWKTDWKKIAKWNQLKLSLSIFSFCLGSMSFIYLFIYLFIFGSMSFKLSVVWLF